MDTEKKARIIAFIRNQLAQAGSGLDALTYDDAGNKLPHRNVYNTLFGYMQEFAKGNSEPRWVAVAGLRGVGKTTLLAQLYTNFQAENSEKLYIPLDRAASLGFSLHDILAAYEEFLGISFEKLQKPLYLFLDEVHYQKGWAVTAKAGIYDRSRKIFILATGSSAVALEKNADVARRMVLDKLYPLGFTEYINVKLHKTLSEGLSQRIHQALFFSESAEDVYQKLQKERGAITSFWTGIEQFEIDRYLKYGTLPFALSHTNESLIYQNIGKVMDDIIEKDVTQLNAFDKPTLSKLSQLLYAIAGADTVSLVKFGQTVDLDPKTITQALDTLEKTEVLLRIYPYGAHYSQVKKPSKYLFTSSAYRAMYYNLIGSVEQYDNYKGRLLEDIVGMYLTKAFVNNIGVSLSYDSREGGADFILSIRSRKEKIVLEVGTGKKGTRQAVYTLKHIKGKYGLIISPSQLTLHIEDNCVVIPLEYFLLL